MADDDGDKTPPAPDGEPQISLAQIKDAVREVLAEMDPGPDPDPDDGDDDDAADTAVYSVRQAEDIARRAVEQAMGALNAKPKPKPKPKSGGDDGDGGTSGTGDAKPKGEASPTPPKESPRAFGSRVREFLVGSDA